MLLLSLLASLSLHLVLLALLLWRSPARPPESQLVAFEVELSPAPTLLAPPAPPVAAPSRRTAEPRRPQGRGSAPAVAAPEAPSDGFRSEALPLLGAPEGRADPDLRPRWALAPREAGEEGTATAPPGDALGQWIREQAARGRVENGLVHPYYRDVGRAFLGSWDAERAVKKRGLRGYLAQLGENVRTFGRVWQELAEGFGKTGAPAILDGSSSRVKELSGLPAGPATDSLMRAEIGRQLGGAYSRDGVTLVRVTQAADGRLLSVKLESPSRDAAMDHAAVAAVRKAAEALPAPPDEARAGRDTLVSLWEFELEVSITPPVPMIAFELDEVLGVTDVRVPLDRRIWKRVRLVAVF